MKPSATSPQGSSSISLAAFVAGTALLAGTLDITAAMTNYVISTGKNPLQVLSYVASGVFGKSAFSGNPAMLAWGLFFHYCIALLVTSFFFWLSPRVGWLGRHKVLAGLLYGVGVWVVMNLLVVPSSQAPTPAFNPQQAFINAVILMVCIGLPISWSAAHYFAGRRTVNS